MTTTRTVVLSPYDRRAVQDINAGRPRCCTFHHVLATGALSDDYWSVRRYLADLRERNYCGTNGKEKE